MACEAAKNASGCKSTRCENGFGDFARGTVVSQKDDPFLGEHGVDKNDDGVCIGAAGGQMRM